MDLFICSKCGANLIEVGLVEATIGGVSRTMFRFRNKKAEHDDTCLGDFDDQWVECGACGAELHDRTAIEIIEAYENDLPHTRDDEEEEEE